MKRRALSAGLRREPGKQIVSNGVERSFSLRRFGDPGSRYFGLRGEITQFSYATLDFVAAHFELSLGLEKRKLVVDELRLPLGKLPRVLTSLLCEVSNRRLSSCSAWAKPTKAAS